MVSSKADAGAIRTTVTPRSMLPPARAMIAASALCGKEQSLHQSRELRLLPCPLSGVQRTPGFERSMSDNEPKADIRLRMAALGAKPH